MHLGVRIRLRDSRSQIARHVVIDGIHDVGAVQGQMGNAPVAAVDDSRHGKGSRISRGAYSVRVLPRKGQLTSSDLE